MAIDKFKQPAKIEIEKGLRLRAYDGKYDFAFEWYQDFELVKQVDGPAAVLYTEEKLKRMYEYLNTQGELYFIEVLRNDKYHPIGDIALCMDNLPIVIGDKSYQNKGIGRKAVLALIERAKEIGFELVKIGEIYDYNIPSQKLFKGLGFEECGQAPNGKSYALKIKGE